MKLIGSRVFFDQFWQQTCKNKTSMQNQILCIVQQIGPELILQFVRLYSVYTTVVKHHQSEIIWVGGNRKNSSAGADSPDTCRTRSSSWQSWNQHKFLVFWWLWEQHTRFNTRLNIWVAIWRCVALPRPLNLQSIANLWTNGLQNCKNLGSSAIACRSHHFQGKQIC